MTNVPSHLKTIFNENEKGIDTEIGWGLIQNTEFYWIISKQTDDDVEKCKC